MYMSGFSTTESDSYLYVTTPLKEPRPAQTSPDRSVIGDHSVNVAAALLLLLVDLLECIHPLLDFLIRRIPPLQRGDSDAQATTQCR